MYVKCVLYIKIKLIKRSNRIRKSLLISIKVIKILEENTKSKTRYTSLSEPSSLRLEERIPKVLSLLSPSLHKLVSRC